jgi:hypothetical protein
MSRVFRHAVDAMAVNAVYLRAAFAASRVAQSATPRAVPRLEALRIAAGRASTRAELTLAQAAGALAPDYAEAYQRVHACARRMAALAGVVRAGVESGIFTLPAGAEVRMLLTKLEAQLAELAMRPGLADTTSSAERPALPPAAALDAFLAEQADYAAAHIAAAHAAVADLRTLGAAARKLPGRRRAHSG